MRVLGRPIPAVTLVGPADPESLARRPRHHDLWPVRLRGPHRAETAAESAAAATAAVPAFFLESKIFGSADGWPAEGQPAGGGARWGERCWQVRQIDGIHGNDCSGGRHHQYRIAGRQRTAGPDERAAGPDERTRRENLTSPVQIGPPATDQSAGNPSTACIWHSRDRQCTDPQLYRQCTAGSWAGQPGRGSGPGTQRFARQREGARGARS